MTEKGLMNVRVISTDMQVVEVKALCEKINYAPGNMMSST